MLAVPMQERATGFQFGDDRGPVPLAARRRIERSLSS